MIALNEPKSRRLCFLCVRHEALPGVFSAEAVSVVAPKGAKHNFPQTRNLSPTQSGRKDGRARARNIY
jgi:hypothetical protein